MVSIMFLLNHGITPMEFQLCGIMVPIMWTFWAGVYYQGDGMNYKHPVHKIVVLILNPHGISVDFVYFESTFRNTLNLCFLESLAK